MLNAWILRININFAISLLIGEPTPTLWLLSKFDCNLPTSSFDILVVHKDPNPVLMLYTKASPFAIS